MKVKMKTCKAMQSRFKVTATGKVMHNRPGRRHKLTNKSGNRKRKLHKPNSLVGAQAKMYVHLIT